MAVAAPLSVREWHSDGEPQPIRAMLERLAGLNPQVQSDLRRGLVTFDTVLALVTSYYCWSDRGVELRQPTVEELANTYQNYLTILREGCGWSFDNEGLDADDTELLQRCFGQPPRPKPAASEPLPMTEQVLSSSPSDMQQNES
eukprot:gnl/Hemi2/7083_TR2424_c0_g1_i1.p1 gnl/Hemi2/7083_TR2424_c0_g1~~gnl/Hemi2/7083_TR2424_c0_g1_i1.p1  ORF type:complete len:144 (+),score=8.02 gnl/Hemi2/7083_TR2424_c0_g1_i1:213-644(+)